MLAYMQQDAIGHPEHLQGDAAVTCYAETTTRRLINEKQAKTSVPGACTMAGFPLLVTN